MVLKQQGQIIGEHAIKELDDLVISSKCGMLSIALIEELIQNGTQIHFINYKYEPFVTVYTPAHHGSVKARRGQLLSYQDHRGVTVAKEIIRCKLQNQINIVKYYMKSRQDKKLKHALQSEILAIQRYISEIRQIDGKRADDVRMRIMTREAHAAKHYWKCVKILLKGKVDFAGRNHRLKDPVNMMLNYGYGILGSRVIGAIIRAGLEPFAGFIHVDRSGRPSLQLDFMEMYRQPVVDRVVISLLTRGFQPKTEKLEDESEFLSKRTRRVLGDAIKKRLEGRQDYRGKNFMLKTIMQLQARALASFFKEGSTGSTSFTGFISRW